MAKDTLAQSQDERRSRADIDHYRRRALSDISDRFQVAESVNKLQHLMGEVTKKEINADTVNAACNCVNNINTTIKTAIAAAKFLSDT